jgi:endo-1,4-beta-xylanase
MSRPLNSLWRHPAILTGMLLSALFAATGNGQSRPSGNSLLAADSLGAIVLQGSQKNLAHLSSISVQGQSFSKALKISSDFGSQAESNIQLVATTTDAVAAGDVLFAHFFLRCDESATAQGFTRLIVSIGNSEPLAELRVSAGGQWKECYLPFRARRAVPAGKGQIAFLEGFDSQTIEIGGIGLLDLGPDAKLESLPHTSKDYVGHDANAPWRAAALARIEQIRKGDFTIQVTDAAGKPEADARVHAVLQRHAFGWGTCVDAADLLGDSADDLRYQKTVAELFNQATFENEMKWYSTWDGIPPEVDQAMGWLQAHHIAVRGHNLVWPSWHWSPKQLQQFANDPAELHRRIDDHITLMMSHFRGQCFQWDVVNEVFANHDLVDALGGPSIMLEWFKLAHQGDPASALYINDYGIVEGGAVNGHRDTYYHTIQYLLKNGAPLSGIGIQSHFGTDLPPPAQIVSVLDHFAQLGLPIESTEVSLDLTDRQLQSDYLRDYLIAVFSEPAVKGITLWGFWSKRHWRPQGALYADDWTIRPHGQTYIDLVHHQWQTDVTLTTDAAGQAHFRGFFGTYAIDANNKTDTVDLAQNGGHATIAFP